jgi:hypothetical protein
MSEISAEEHSRELAPILAGETPVVARLMSTAIITATPLLRATPATAPAVKSPRPVGKWDTRVRLR